MYFQSICSVSKHGISVGSNAHLGADFVKIAIFGSIPFVLSNVAPATVTIPQVESPQTVVPQLSQNLKVTSPPESLLRLNSLRLPCIRVN